MKKLGDTEEKEKHLKSFRAEKIDVTLKEMTFRLNTDFSSAQIPKDRWMSSVSQGRKRQPWVPHSTKLSFRSRAK